MEKLTECLSGSDSKTSENGKNRILLVKKLFYNFKVKLQNITKINIDKEKRLMQNIFAPSSSAEGGSGFINCPVK